MTVPAQDHQLSALLSESAPELRSCGDKHVDWTELAEHLVQRFPAVTAGEVLAELTRARAAAISFSLSDDDQLETAEIIARHALLLATGQIPDVARLDPETHARRQLA